MWRDPKSFSIKRTVKRRTRQSACEPLEQRIVPSIASPVSPTVDLLAAAADEPVISPQHVTGPMFPGGLLITATEIITETEIIPRFVANPTISNVRSGNWTDPTIWSLGRVPTDLDRVAIGANTVVTYSALSNARIDGLEISGSLVFSTAVNTRLLVANLTVMPSGTLQIGTAANPLPRQINGLRFGHLPFFYSLCQHPGNGFARHRQVAIDIFHGNAMHSAVVAAERDDLAARKQIDRLLQR